MEYPEVPLTRWLNLPYNVVISFPLGFSERGVLGFIIKTIPNSILITNNDVEDYYKEFTPELRRQERSLNRRGNKGHHNQIRGKIYSFSDLPERIPRDLTVIVHSNDFNPTDLEEYSDNKLIFILGYGYTMELFETIENLYSPFIYGLFTSFPSGLGTSSSMAFTVKLLKTIEINIPNFTIEYDELDENTEAARCNFDYLPEWEKYEDLLVDKGGWMREELLDKIYSRGPKLEILFDLITESPQNTVIFTLFSSEYGAYLVANTLRLEKYDVLLATDNGSEEARRKVYNKFNDIKESRDDKILVTNVIPETVLDNVSRIIFFDSTSVDTRRDLIRHCRDSQISLIALEAVIEGYETADQDANDLFLTYQEDTKEAYEEVRKIASKITLNNRGEAIVQQRSSPR